MPDCITVSVLQRRLEAIVQEMGEAMRCTVYSQISNASWRSLVWGPPHGRRAISLGYASDGPAL